MDERGIKTVGYLIVGCASLITLAFLIRLGIHNLITILFSAWVLAPYIVLGFLLRKRCRTVREASLNCITAFIVSAGGIYMLADVMFFHSDAQGAIAVLMVPLFQFTATVILTVVFMLFGKKRREHE